MIPCKHWSNCDVTGGGCCSHPEQPHGPKISGGVCLRVCEKYDGPARGLGDTVERLAKLSGVKGVVKAGEAVASAITGKKADCGCSQRRAALNEVMPYALPGNCAEQKRP